MLLLCCPTGQEFIQHSPIGFLRASVGKLIKTSILAEPPDNQLDFLRWKGLFNDSSSPQWMFTTSHVTEAAGATDINVQWRHKSQS